MAILTAVIESRDLEGEYHREVHTIGHFLEDDEGQIVYSDGEGGIIDNDDLQDFIKYKVAEYNVLLQDKDILSTFYYGTFYNFDIYDAKLEYGINDVTEKLGYLREFK